MLKFCKLAIVTLCLVGIPVSFLHSQETPRHINFNSTLRDLDGNPMTYPMSEDKADKRAKELTLSDVAVIALTTPIDDDRSITGDKKFELGLLAQKIYHNKNAELTIDELEIIKTRIGKCPSFSSILVMEAWKLLDPALLKK